MWYLGLIGLSIGLAVGLAALGGGAGLGKATSSALEGTARQPESSGELRTTLIIGAALIEALTIYSLVIGILLLGKLPNAAEIVDVLKKMGG
ncbi:MAG: ATP synthase F0 subunit C [Proteobacteria bacterium]|nr:ATP synthase F0 subunit C [Pseudomonadota bacterium]